MTFYLRPTSLYLTSLLTKKLICSHYSTRATSNVVNSPPTKISPHDIDEKMEITENGNKKILISSAKCEPTELLLEVMQKEKNIAEMVKRIQNEFEIYEYFATQVPTRFLDKHWVYLLKTTSTLERVRYFAFMALTEHRKTLDDERHIKMRAINNEIRNRTVEKYNSGEMAYGTSLGYQLIKNPLKSQPDYHKPFTFWNAWAEAMPSEHPMLLLDCQFIPELITRNYKRVSRSTEGIYYVNYEQRSPLPLSFINANLKDLMTKNMLRRSIITSEMRLLRKMPPVYEGNPFHNPHERDPKKQVIYISRFGREVLDGPLLHKAYVIPLIFESANTKEVIGAIRGANYRAMCLPIRKYVKWQSGQMNLSYIVLLQILREVAANGGDWEYALRKYIPKFHMMTTEERREKVGIVRSERIKERREEKRQIVATIIDTLGHQPPIFADKMAWDPAVEEYARQLHLF